MASRLPTPVTPPVAAAEMSEVSNPERVSSAPIGGKAKRCFDVVFAALALVTLSPLLLMIAALIKLSDGGPILFRHKRVGLHSRSFDCLKFRTMVENERQVFHHHLEACPEAAREWAQTRKLKSDPRITAVGSVLRQLSLDELPQLVNILKGEMSVVGPRPVVFKELELYGPHVTAYLKARPGLTGVWQVSGRNDLPYSVRATLDRTYVEQWSFSSDIVIILKTVPAVIASRGVY
jgi:exopolysaccharide production protein ExoY